MQVEFLLQFYKDLDAISQKSVKSGLRRLILQLESSENFQSLPHLKKLSGHKSAYRFRIGDYRVGFFYVNNTIILARILHRKKIYRSFP